MTEQIPEYQIRRDGSESSEYGLAIKTAFLLPPIVGAISFLNERFKLGIEPNALAAMILTIGGAIYGYIKTRGDVKVSRNMASAQASSQPINAGEVNVTTPAATAGAVLQSAGAQIVSNEIQRVTGVDLGDELQGAFGFTGAATDADDSDGLTDDEAATLQRAALLREENEDANY